MQQSSGVRVPCASSRISNPRSTDGLQCVCQFCGLWTVGTHDWDLLWGVQVCHLQESMVKTEWIRSDCASAAKLPSWPLLGHHDQNFELTVIVDHLIIRAMPMTVGPLALVLRHGRYTSHTVIILEASRQESFLDQALQGLAATVVPVQQLTPTPIRQTQENCIYDRSFGIGR